MGAAAQEETGMPFMHSCLTKLARDKVETTRIGSRGDLKVVWTGGVKVAGIKEVSRND